MGELLQHEILNSLKSSQNEWLINLLGAFNCGDIATFKSTQSAWSAQTDLKVFCFFFQILKKKNRTFWEIVVNRFFFSKIIKNSTLLFLESCQTTDGENVSNVPDGNDLCATCSWSRHFIRRNRPQDQPGQVRYVFSLLSRPRYLKIKTLNYW